MIQIEVPDFGTLELQHLVLDMNGTLAVDGTLVAGVGEHLAALAEWLTIHVVTADTFGRVWGETSELPCQVHVLPKEKQDVAKRDCVRGLGAAHTVCVGNGRNDRLMLEEAALGIAVVQAEGAAPATLMAADVVFPSICDALEALRRPLRLVATLRR